MARAAFIMDRLMSRVGLNGKSFIPLLSSYACAIPGIMATRTIENPKDRLVTILVAPLMSCSARLPVYLLMIAALLPGGSVSIAAKVGIMLLMYALGTFGAFGFAWLFKRTLLKGAPPLMIMELPPYRLPGLKDVLLHMVERAGLFLRRAGTVILGISIILWFLAAYPKAPEGATATQQLAQSFAGRAGHALQPVIKPLGFDWQIGIGLISSFAAREVFVSTMGVVFNAETKDENTTSLQKAIAVARWPDGRRLFTPLVCISLMVFYVFAMQCMSTIAVVRRETNGWKWPIFQTALHDWHRVDFVVPCLPGRNRDRVSDPRSHSANSIPLFKPSSRACDCIVGVAVWLIGALPREAEESRLRWRLRMPDGRIEGEAEALSG